MNNILNVNEIKQQTSIVNLLSRLGYEPKKVSGKEHFYCSMLRDSDTKPSLCVNSELDVWFDHGMGKGGNVIDFGLLYWKNYAFHEVLTEIIKVCNMDLDRLSAPVGKINELSRKRRPVKIPNYKIEEIKALGTNYAITDYIKSRCIWNVAQKRLKEVYYYVTDEKHMKKDFFAAGWQNENGGWEVRNKYFKGCLGRKGLTFISGSSDHVSVFEGYMNYLSWLSENMASTDTVIVLNSIAFLSAGIKRAIPYQKVHLYFDLDPSGEEATRLFQSAIPTAIDQSHIYKGYNDYNEKLQVEFARLLANKNISPQR